VNIDQCDETKLNDTSLKCLLVKEDEETSGLRCEDIKKSCDDVDNKMTCETKGSVINDGNETVDCFWLEKSGEEPKVQCVNKVLL
jgi:hypothetical protein